MMRRGPAAATLVTALLGLALVPGGAAAAELPGLITGFSDPNALQRAPEQRPATLAHIRQARGSIVRLMIDWNDVAPTRPPTEADARNPDWPGYRWEATDAMVRDIAGQGLRPLMAFLVAPAWAEGPNRPPVTPFSGSAPAGSWRPDPVAYRSFAEAVARRYSGRQADPLAPGRTLPRVKDWQAWNEPNLTNYLAPQWRRQGGRLVPESPTRYKALLNAFYDGVKAVDPSNYVVSAGTAPFGDPNPGDARMPPAFFNRAFLCVSGRARPRAVRCAQPAKFDALAHHPYPIGPPGREAINPDDVVVPDLAKLTRPLKVAVEAGTVRPKRPKQLWATEMSWDSEPDPNGLPVAIQARWLQGAFYTLWRQGVSVVAWWQVRDDARRGGYDRTLQSGVFFRGETAEQDRPKPSFDGFRFPLTAYRSSKRAAVVWGIAPARGNVAIQRREGSAWRTIATLRAGSTRTFTRRMPLASGTTVRAVQGAETSLPWAVG